MTDETERRGPIDSIVGWLQIGAILAFIAIAIFITFSMSRSSPQRGDERPAALVPVNLITPQLSDHQVTISLTGTVSTRADVNLTPQVSGRIIEISDQVRAGSQFESGETLFQIDQRDYQVALTRARASLANARSSLAQTQAEADIAKEVWQDLYPDRPIDPLAALEPQLEAAEGQVLSAEADLADAQLNLSRTAFSLPFSGRILDSQIEVGALVNAGQSYGRAYDLNGLELVAPISPSDLARIDGAQGRDVQIVFDGGNALEGEVSRVGAGLDARTRFIDLFVSFSDRQDMVQPGLFADINVEGPLFQDVFRLPASAMPSIEYVYLVDDGVIATHPLTVIDRTRDHVIVERFDYKQGVVVSSLPANAIGREANIVTLDGESTAQ